MSYFAVLKVIRTVIFVLVVAAIPTATALWSQSVGAFLEQLRRKWHVLTDPSQRSLVLWKQMTQEGNSIAPSLVITFLDTHPHWPDRSVIRRHFEKRLYQDPKLLSVVRARKYFESYPPLSVEGLIAFVRLIATHPNPKHAVAMLREFWYTTSLSASQEQKIYQEARQYLRPYDHIQRAERAVWDKRVEDARRMLGYLQEPERQFIAVCIGYLTNNQELIDQAVSLPKDFLKREIFLWGKVHGIRKTTEGPLEGYLFFKDNIAPVMREKHRASWWTLQKSLGQALMVAGYGKEAYDLLSAGPALAKKEQQAHQHLLLAMTSLLGLKQEDQALFHFKQAFHLTENKERYAKAAFWLGYLKEKQGHITQAKSWYEQAQSKPSTFYGQCAAYKMNQAFNPAWVSLKLPQDRSLTVAARKTPRASLILLRTLKELCDVRPVSFDLVRKFLKAVWSDPHLTSLRFHALLWVRAVDPFSIVEFLENPESKGQQDLLYKERFPIMALKKAVPELDKDIIPLIAAVAHTETHFNPYARGGAGEWGMMQLMPATALQEAEALGWKNFQEQQLLSVQKNVILGTAHLRRLFKQFSKDVLAVIGAYNAGATITKKWVKNHEVKGNPYDFSWIAMIEMFPYPTTRDYIQRVWAAYQLMRHAEAL